MDPKSTRLEPIDPASMTAEQKAIHDAIVGGPRGGLRGPFPAWLHHPLMAEPAQELGARLRFRGDLDDREREIAICVTARAVNAQFEWYAHAKIALEAGVPEAVLDAIANRQAPVGLTPREQLIHDLCLEMHGSKTLSDNSFRKAVELLGQRGLVEIVMLCGYYTLVGFTLNVFDMPRPEGGPKPLPA